RSDDNLIFRTEGGEIELSNFFSRGADDLPTLSLPGDVAISGKDMLTAMGAEELLTAAGPSQSTTSGLNSYADDPNALIDGVDKLGKQGTDYWQRENENSDEYEGTAPGMSARAQADRPGPVANNPSDTPDHTPTSVPSGKPTDTPTDGPAFKPTGPDAPTDGPASNPTGPDAPTDTPTDAPVEPADMVSTYNTMFLVDISSSTTSHLPEARKEALYDIAKTIQKFCEDYQKGGEEGELNLAVVLFSGTEKATVSLDMVSFDPKSMSPSDVYDLLAKQIAGVTLDNSTSTNYEAGFNGALQYVTDNPEVWSQEGAINKVFFISDGQPTTSNRSNAGGWVHNDGQGNATSADRVTSEEVVYLRDENGRTVLDENGNKVIDRFNELQENYNAFTRFLEGFQEATGLEVDVHGLGLIPTSMAHYQGVVHGTNYNGLFQFNQIMSFFDNTGELQSFDDWAMRYRSGELSLDNASQGSTSFVRGWAELGKQLYATLTSTEDTVTEYKQFYVDGNNGYSNDGEGYDGNAVFYIQGNYGGERTSVDIGDGDNIVYIGSGAEMKADGSFTVKTGTADVTLGDGDNTVITSWSMNGTITTGDGDNSIDIRYSGGVTVNTGDGNDTIYLDYSSNKVSTGSGNDVVFLGGSHNSTITLGEGSDTIVVDSFKTSHSKTAGTDVYNNSSNKIVNFDFGEDRLDIGGLLECYSEDLQDIDTLLDKGLLTYTTNSKTNSLTVTFEHNDAVAHSSQNGEGGWDQRPVASGEHAKTTFVFQDSHGLDVDDSAAIAAAIRAALGVDSM
ncbi:hypothetical protein LJC46_09915, partial [Desulfovibrio sp. OttesenSCG-928-G15]|nr:hypothetical protein [Desulfovibrio sp. OttesenSCG-928-G15]